MRVHPVTGQPEVARAEQSILAAHESLASSGAQIQAELASGDGAKHVQDMLEDYQRILEQMISASDSFLRDACAAQLAYIQARLEGWKVAVLFGQRARAMLERRTVGPIIQGGPGMPD